LAKPNSQALVLVPVTSGLFFGEVFSYFVSGKTSGSPPQQMFHPLVFRQIPKSRGLVSPNAGAFRPNVGASCILLLYPAPPPPLTPLAKERVTLSCKLPRVWPSGDFPPLPPWPGFFSFFVDLSDREDRREGPRRLVGCFLAFLFGSPFGSRPPEARRAPVFILLTAELCFLDFFPSHGYFDPSILL